MKAINILDIGDKVRSLYKHGIDAGYKLGFRCLDGHYRVKLGCTTYITGIPGHGKTEFHQEILVQLSETYGLKHAIFTPEQGKPEEIVADLCHKYLRKNFQTGYNNRMSEQELEMALPWLHEHFIILDQDADETLTPTEVWKQCVQLPVHTYTIDPWNELWHDVMEYGGREDKYLEYVLGLNRRLARKYKKHSFIIVHPSGIRAQDGVFPVPNFYDISGGKMWANKAESVICVYLDKDRQVEIHVQKAKPKVIGRKTAEPARLEYDLSTARYSEPLIEYWNND